MVWADFRAITLRKQESDLLTQSLPNHQHKKMNTKDMTLLQFLRSFDLGTFREVPADVMKVLGHTDESVADVEMITVELSQPREIGELPALAAAYLMRSGFKSVTATEKSLTLELPKGFAPNAGYTNASLIVGENPDEEKITIMVSYTETECIFAKQPLPWVE